MAQTDGCLNGALHTMHHELSQMAKQKTELSLTLHLFFGEIGTTSSSFNTALQRKKVIDLTLCVRICNERNSY
jgi:hypothetical protein